MNDSNESNNIKAKQRSSGSELSGIVMPEFTQGVCDDGAAILMDGKPLKIEEILHGLRHGDRAIRQLHNANELINQINAVCWNDVVRGFKQVDISKILELIEKHENIRTPQ